MFYVSIAKIWRKVHISIKIIPMSVRGWFYRKLILKHFVGIDTGECFGSTFTETQIPYSNVYCICVDIAYIILNYLLTPWCRVLLEKLTGLQLVKKFPAFHGTRRLITALTSVRHLSLSWASPIQSIYPHPTSRRSILILSTHLRLGLPSGLLPSGSLHNFRSLSTTQLFWIEQRASEYGKHNFLRHKLKKVAYIIPFLICDVKNCVLSILRSSLFNSE